MIKPQLLKYIFQVTYKDGSIYASNQEDVSIKDPKRSCFYDVKQSEVKTFFLFNDEHRFSVNLEDGHFEVDGVPFFMHDLNTNLTGFKLVFYRRHTHDFTPDGTETRHEIVYHMGWECNLNGKNYQQIMKIL